MMLSECCDAEVTVDRYEDKAIREGFQLMYTCKECGNACTTYEGELVEEPEASEEGPNGHTSGMPYCWCNPSVTYTGGDTHGDIKVVHRCDTCKQTECLCKGKVLRCGRCDNGSKLMCTEYEDGFMWSCLISHVHHCPDCGRKRTIDVEGTLDFQKPTP